MNTVPESATTIKSRIFPIATFKDRDDWIGLLFAADDPSLGAKVVGARITLHRNIESAQCNPKIETLVLGTRISQSSVRRHIADLEVTGWLRVDRTLGRYSNSYELRVPTLSMVKGLTAPTLSKLTGFKIPQPCQP